MNQLNIVVGDQAIVEREIREVTALPRNKDNDLTVAWKSKYSSGVCVPSLWLDWLANGGPNY